METPEETPNVASTDADISPLSVTAIQVHEIFTELKSSGFKHQDAIQIVGFMLSSGIMFNPSSSFGFGNSLIVEDTSLNFLGLDEDEDYEDFEDYDDGDDTSPN
jgi:hypothetical protein